MEEKIVANTTKSQVAKASATDKPKATVAKAAPKATAPKAAAKTTVAKPAAKASTKAVAPKVATAKVAATKAAPKASAKPVAAKAAAPEKKETAAPKAAATKASGNEPRLKKFYRTDVVKQLMKEMGYKNVSQVPRLEKIVVNMGLGDVKDNSKSLNAVVEELALITGQKPYITTAKKSISNFKLREGQKIGAKVTLRGVRMYEFLDKLNSIALPRVRDFDGLSNKSFDHRGNYNMGIKEQLIFPEISYEKIEKIRGFDICVVTTAKSDEEAKALLIAMGMPIRK